MKKDLFYEQNRILGFTFNPKDYNECLSAVKQDGNALGFIKKQTYELCMEAVKQNGGALVYCKKQDFDLRLEAVKQNGLALAVCKKQESLVCLEAVKQNELALLLVTNRKVKPFLVNYIERNKQKLQEDNNENN